MRSVEAICTEVAVALRKGSASQLRHRILDGLREAGWTDRIPIAPKVKLTLTAARGKVGLCLQTGNVARMYADLMKLQVSYLDGKISSAVYVVPMLATAKKMGSNVANYERLVRELEVLRKAVTVPLVVIGIGEQEGTNA